MNAKTRKDHPLSRRHFRQIVCRPKPMRQKLLGVWAMTWRPGDHTGSFLGKLFRPIGSATMMVQVSYPLGDHREGIALFGYGAQIDPFEALVSFGELRTRHDFHRVPFVGARGPVLDPSESVPGHHGNGSWVRLALETDRLRHRAALNGYTLPSIPLLPEVYFAFGTRESARFEVTPALWRRAAAGIEVSWSGDSLRDLGGFQSESAFARERALAALPEESQAHRLRAAWEAAFVSPNDPGNSTGMWLLPHELSTDVYSTTRVFEYFGPMVGAHIFNPARTLGKVVGNPAVEVAKEAGFDLVRDLESLVGVAEGTPDFQSVEQRLIDLVPAYRQRLGASEAISDQDLLSAICHYEQPVAVEPALDTLPECEQVRKMRECLAPHLSECYTDGDLLAAAQAPQGPLYASGLCRIQTLRRNQRLPLAEALSFAPAVLGRDRVRADLWHDAWPSDSSRCSAETAVLAAAA